VSWGSVWRVLHEQDWRRKKDYTLLNATCLVYGRYALNMSRLPRSARMWAVFTFWTKRGCAWTTPGAKNPTRRPGGTPRAQLFAHLDWRPIRARTPSRADAGRALTQRSFVLISRILGPCLRCGDVPVLDNLCVHHLTGLQEWLAAHGAEVLFLPPSSPGFIPVEQA
jgi:hypothetical protein